LLPPKKNRADVLEYTAAMGKLAQRILSILAAGLGVNRDQFNRYFREESTSVLRINHYPPCPHPDKIEGLDEHRDPTLITILHQDDVGGLQILKDGKWVGIQPNPKTFIVNIGDILMVSLPSFFFLLHVSSPPTFLDYPPSVCNAKRTFKITSLFWSFLGFSYTQTCINTLNFCELL
jgi:hypothetical protein